jgi:tetratricopeptide (TPR) repeat protein
LTELYLQNNQFDRLLERLERERREADKQREMTICPAQAYQSAGDLGTARQRLERLLAGNAKDTQLLGQLSALAENEGDANLALKYQRQVEKAAPSNRDVQLRLAQLLVKAGVNDEAAAMCVKLVADEPEPHRTLQAIDSILSNGKPETALAVTNRLLAQNLGDWEILYRKRAELAELNRKDEVACHFRAILDLRLPDDQEWAAFEATKEQKPKGGRARLLGSTFSRKSSRWINGQKMSDKFAPSPDSTFATASTSRRGRGRGRRATTAPPRPVKAGVRCTMTRRTRCLPGRALSSVRNWPTMTPCATWPSRPTRAPSTMCCTTSTWISATTRCGGWWTSTRRRGAAPTRGRCC